MSFHYKSVFFSGMVLLSIAIYIAFFTQWDIHLSQTFILSSSSDLLSIVRIISKLGSFISITLFTLILTGYLWIKKRIYDAIWVIITMGSCRIVFAILKIIVGRERPVFEEPLTHALSYSFPSGHSVNTITFLLICYLIFARRNTIIPITIIGTIIIGWSRLALGAHWCSDVLAGWGCGLMWISIAYQVKISPSIRNYALKHFPIHNHAHHG